MNCNCLSSHEAIPVSNLPVANLTLIDNGTWIKLYSCQSCNQFWKVDNHDKYQTNLAIKLDNAQNWEDFDDFEIRKEFLCRSRDGYSSEGCRKLGCNKIALKSLAFCLDHAWEIGLRE